MVIFCICSCIVGCQTPDISFFFFFLFGFFFILFCTGGSKPNLADLAVFGVLRPIRHLQAGRDLVENTKIGEWYDRMDSAVGDPSRING